MKYLITPVLILTLLILFSCGGGGKSKIEQIKQQSTVEPADPYDLWQSNHGVGPVQAFELPAEIDQVLVSSGQEIYESKCTACHKVDKRFIGPAPTGILSRRTPAWIMNMILNPENMVQKDPIAKKLLMEFNGSPMANQNLTNEEARAVLEYFRTL
ncbi:cytochrome c [Marinoscillum sp. MHG1-6]|uniref:c-type cytochrome n=1 Tax=Marinoscillum sp. MHG1-6 TaxID=2959627 RepID=UPI0021585A31|nr:cytochrome c [Marinoscillum sp. MHG1-6]